MLLAYFRCSSATSGGVPAVGLSSGRARDSQVDSGIASVGGAGSRRPIRLPQQPGCIKILRFFCDVILTNLLVGSIFGHITPNDFNDALDRKNWMLNFNRILLNSNNDKINISYPEDTLHI